jgi:hypothetical protein
MYNDSQQDIVYSYYLLTLYSISQGETIEELEEVVLGFEQDDLYEQCDGMRQAIEFAKTNTIQAVLSELNKGIET